MMLLETQRLTITEFTPDMAEAVHENSLDEDNRRFYLMRCLKPLRTLQKLLVF